MVTICTDSIQNRLNSSCLTEYRSYLYTSLTISYLSSRFTTKAPSWLINSWRHWRDATKAINSHCFYFSMENGTAHRYRKTKNRLLKVCYVPATSASLPRLFYAAINNTNEANKAGGTCHKAVYILRCLWNGTLFDCHWW